MLHAPLAICVAGNTRRAMETAEWNDKELEKATITDIPISYLTNPPFGANIKRSEHPYLEKFVLGHKKDKNDKDFSVKKERVAVSFFFYFLSF